ncbi:MAG: hypothetical protein GX262_03095 [Clostridia bacterium]|nr:hypothetical protein [Clostridia bacterium]
MRKRLQQGLSLMLTVTLVLALAIPAAAAGELKLNVNGKETAADLVLQDARSFIEINSLAAVTGAEVEVAEELKVTINGKTYVPLRSVAENVGFQVNWTPGLVVLERAAEPEQTEQVGDSLTAMDVLVKSNQAAQEINTYSMSGYINQTMVMEMDGEEVPIETTSELFGQIQNDPMKLYLKQTVELPGGVPGDVPEEMLSSMEVETYIDEEFMYMKSPGQEGWLKMPHFLPMELLKEQQDITNDPLKAAKQMLEMGYDPGFGDDAVIDGRECYTVKASIDMAKAMESQQEMLQQIIGSVGQMTAAEMGAEVDPAQMEGFSKAFELILAKMMEEGVFDYQVTMFIDKETFLPAQMNLVMTMKFDFNVLEFMEVISEAVGEELPEELVEELQVDFKMNSSQQGEIRLFDYGAEFVEPDLTNVIEAGGLFNDLGTVPSE